MQNLDNEKNFEVHDFKQPNFSTAHDLQINCPKCGHKTSLLNQECKFCGILLPIAIEDSEDPIVRGNLSLIAAWKDVIENYEDILRHENFFSMAIEKGKLAHLAWRYGSLLKLMPQDQMTKKMINRIRALGAIPQQKAKKGVYQEIKRNWGVHSIAYILAGFMITLSFLDMNFLTLRIPGGILLAFALIMRIWFISRV